MTITCDGHMAKSYKKNIIIKICRKINTNDYMCTQSKLYYLFKALIPIMLLDLEHIIG